MAKTTVITGSASGIGAAIRKRLEDDGDRVIGVDLVDAEILADLSGSEGRNAAVAAALEQCGGRLDRLVTCAGLGTHVRPPSLVASVNYFGAVDVLDGLFEALGKGSDPAVVVIVSNSAQMAPLDDSPFVKALLEHALGRAVRRRACKWGDARIRLNGVAPGPVQTPLLQGALDDPDTGDAVRGLNVPIGRWGEPEEVAALVAFLFGPEARWIHGSIFYIDGGNDAAIRPDRY
jgi:NAD(P)-dependent dehydrogenase (short-subunit alcohol dehydrogenase family)